MLQWSRKKTSSYFIINQSRACSFGGRPCFGMVVTGTLAGPLIRECADALMQKYPQVKITVHEIKNEYFGGNVSVAGLVTGTDIIKQCSGKLHSDLLAVPEVMIRDEKGQFLDDITLEELGRALGCRAVSIPTDGGGCCKAMLSTHKRKTIKFKR